MQPAEIQELYDYASWATGTLLQKAGELTPEEFAAPNAFPWGSIRGTFRHILSAQNVWQQRIAYGVSPTSLQSYAEMETVADLRAAFDVMEGHWRAWLGTCTAETLAADTTWKNTRGATASLPLWLVLTHLVNHSTQHNSELAQMLTEMGRSPGDIDLLFWAVRRNKPA